MVCFPLTKLSRKGPEETARLVGEYLLQHSGLVAKYNVVKGFLNLVINDRIWIEFFNLFMQIKILVSFLTMDWRSWSSILAEYQQAAASRTSAK